MKTKNLSVFPFVLALSALSPACADEEEPIPQEYSEADLEPSAESGSSSYALTAPAGAGRYDRAKALQYIERHAKDPSRWFPYCASLRREGGRYVKVPGDCTNFASQVLYHGGIPQSYTNSEEAGWWYRYSCTAAGSSKSWRQVNRLLQYLTVESGIGEYRREARELQVGDLIFYRLRREEDGYRCDGGNLFNHATVVSGFDSDGQPLVSYHSNDALHVPWAAQNGTPKALGKACLVAFVHIRD